MDIVWARSVRGDGAPARRPRSLCVVLIAFTHAIVLFVLVRSLGAASGAYSNPAVTCALLYTLS
jgi:glycerol uptake facilitator-like aquaporin